MIHKILFKMCNPSVEKFALYESLIPELDSVICNAGVILEKRENFDKSFKVKLTVYANSPQQLAGGFVAGLAVLNRNAIEFETISHDTEEDICVTQIVTTWTLSLGYRNEKTWQKWLECMPTIDSYASSYGIVQTRTNCHKTYKTKIESSFTELSAISINSFHVGRFLTNMGIYIEPIDDYSIEEIRAEDLIDELKNVTTAHKQLTLL